MSHEQKPEHTFPWKFIQTPAYGKIGHGLRQCVYFSINYPCKRNADLNNSASFLRKSERSSVVELHLAKVVVESSNLFARSNFNPVRFASRVFFSLSRDYICDLQRWTLRWSTVLRTSGTLAPISTRFALRAGFFYSTPGEQSQDRGSFLHATRKFIRIRRQ